MDTDKRKTQIKKEIESLTQELNKIELIEEKTKEAHKVGLGDYLLHYGDTWQLSQVCIDDDGKFRLYYPMYKELLCDTFDTIENLFIDFIECYEDTVHIPVKTDRVRFLENGKKYFIFSSYHELNEWKIIKIDIEQDIAIAYNIENETDIIQADILEILYINLLEEYEYIAEVHEDKK